MSSKDRQTDRQKKAYGEMERGKKEKKDERMKAVLKNEKKKKSFLQPPPQEAFPNGWK